MSERVVPEGAFGNAACSSRGVFSDGAPLLIMREGGCPRVRWAKHGKMGDVGKACKWVFSHEESHSFFLGRGRVAYGAELKVQ